MSPSVTGTARVPVTCGELLQGVVNGRPFQVPCPLGLRGRIQVTARPGDGAVRIPTGHPKARAAAKLALRYAGRPPVDLRVALRTPVRRGAGMGSSTCDVVGTLRAAFRALDHELDGRTLARLAATVEPTDGVMFGELVAFDHSAGAVIERLGEPPPIRVLVLDVGGVVDTLGLHRRRFWDDRSAFWGVAPIYRALLAQVRDGIRTGDAEAIGRAATRSASLSRSAATAVAMEPALALSQRFGGYGVAAAHSGTVAGVLFPDDPERVAAARRRAHELPSVVRVRSTQLESGIGSRHEGDMAGGADQMPTQTGVERGKSGRGEAAPPSAGVDPRLVGNEVGL